MLGAADTLQAGEVELPWGEPPEASHGDAPREIAVELTMQVGKVEAGSPRSGPNPGLSERYSRSGSPRRGRRGTGMATFRFA